MPTTIRLDPQTEARLNHLAEKTGRTKAFYLRGLIEQHLEDLEDAYLGELAWEEFKACGKPAIPFEQIKEELGLED